ncbi:unnamed protein product [Parnassius apollo]|uniref:(apollo) hypothetical protein n=1 Tax=Parnassius apollo TaxID=110799 RepID=A0A8S3WGQ8_PARAO|nr:unnamed protein product [Parnassius apollo]
MLSTSPTDTKMEAKTPSLGIKLRRWCRSRRCQLWRLLLLPFIPILALIVQTTLSLKNSLTNGREVADVEEQVSRATELGKLVTRLQQERSEVAFFIFTNGSTLRSNLTQRFADTDSAVQQMGDLPVLVFKNRSKPVDGNSFLAELSALRRAAPIDKRRLHSKDTSCLRLIWDLK